MIKLINKIIINQLKGFMVLICLAMVIVFIYTLSSPGDTYYNYFSRLATSFLNGQLYLTIHPPELNELVPVNGRYYVVYPPMPAVLMAPLFWLIGHPVSQTAFSILVATITLILAYHLFRKIGWSVKTALLMMVLWGFGTDYWYLASIGSAWFLAHTVASLFLILALLAAFGRKRWFVVGLMIGSAYWSRTTTIFSLVFFYIYFSKDFWPVNSKNLRHLIFLHLGVGIFVILDCYYNFVRFGDFSPLSAYQLIPHISQDPYFKDGFMSVNFISRHLNAIFIQLPKFQNSWPYLIPSLYSTAIWFTSPALLLVFKSKFNRWTISCVSAILVTMSVISLWAGVGYAQWGYRFLQDVLPFLLLLLGTIYAKKPSKWLYLLVFISVLINLWAIVLINKLQIYTI